jgi:hypothetical protein
MSNGGGASSNIPQDLIEAIASSTAISVGEQPAILANLALANQIANTNLAQQNAISNQQAMFQLELTIVSKCVELIANINPTSTNAAQQLDAYKQIMQMFLQQGKTTASAPPPPAAPVNSVNQAPDNPVNQQAASTQTRTTTRKSRAKKTTPP